MKRGRPTLRGIQMRSRLEADFAAHADRMAWPWKYEPLVFAGPGGQWLPDFQIGSCEFEELKPLALWRWGSAEIGKILQQMAVAWESNPDLVLRLRFWSYGGSAQQVLEAWGGDRLWHACYDLRHDELGCYGHGECPPRISAGRA